MRRLAVLIVLAACPAVAPAQAPPPAPAAPAVVAHLQAWERVMAGSKSFWSQCTVSRRNEATKISESYKGAVMCLKPGYARTMIELQPAAGQPPASVQGVFEMYIITPTAVHEYTGTGVDRTTGKLKPRTYTETRFAPGQRPQNVMLDLLSGTMTADQVLRRFDVSLVKQDANYIYLGILPKRDNKRDQEDFQSMSMVLYQPATGFGYLPATVMFTKDALGQQIDEWTFLQPKLNQPEVTVQQFAPVAIPANDPNWQVIRKVAGAAPAGPPRR